MREERVSVLETFGDKPRNVERPTLGSKNPARRAVWEYRKNTLLGPSHRKNGKIIKQAVPAISPPIFAESRRAFQEGFVRQARRFASFAMARHVSIKASKGSASSISSRSSTIRA